MNRLLVIALLVLSGCSAPKDAHKHFHRPKYSISQHVRQGRPPVVQRWWSSAWFWQRRYTPYTRSIR